MLPFWRCRALRSVGECVYCLVRTSRIRWTLERLSLCASVRCEGSASFLLSGVFVKIQRQGLQVRSAEIQVFHDSRSVKSDFCSL